ncbi:hypothetical protein BDQ94DRAFT_155336 [Aspergillus welwitschiae]|uniref:Uncharacterized protein n=1 Tax=Aspergillus welwitschiae TaxID=1341132 RepID=A0A3F3PI87_9EURO|nr:hypothetical protein BDQ94DRAFT_155336 [Aspergillus welwitschiae]RDH26567.1 hypothetical protein BDQ94DRAFT_155336 [Aspergillus welwitschiae]
MPASRRGGRSRQIERVKFSVLRWETAERLHAIWPTRTRSHGKQRLTVGNILAACSFGEQRKFSLCFALMVTAILRARRLCS